MDNQPMTYKGMMDSQTPDAPSGDTGSGSTSVAALHGEHQGNIEALISGLNEVFTKMFHGSQSPTDVVDSDPIQELVDHLNKYKQLLTIVEQEKSKK